MTTEYGRLLSTQWDFFWAPPDATVVQRDEIAYVACPRDYLYANTVTKTDAPTHRLPSLLDEVQAAHVGVRSRWAVYEGHGATGLPELLPRYGYDEPADYDAMVVGTDEYRARPAAGIEVREVRDLAGLRAWLHVNAQAFSGRPMVDDEPSQLQRELDLCTRPGRRTLRYVAWDAGGEPVAAASMNDYPALGLCFFWGGGTAPAARGRGADAARGAARGAPGAGWGGGAGGGGACPPPPGGGGGGFGGGGAPPPAARGRGAYSALVAARVAAAAELGASLVGIFAKTDTSAPIVGKQGFRRIGRKSYWDRPIR